MLPSNLVSTKRRVVQTLRSACACVSSRTCDEKSAEQRDSPMRSKQLIKAHAICNDLVQMQSLIGYDDSSARLNEELKKWEAEKTSTRRSGGYCCQLMRWNSACWLYIHRYEQSVIYRRCLGAFAAISLQLFQNRRNSRCDKTYPWPRERDVRLKQWIKLCNKLTESINKAIVSAFFVFVDLIKFTPDNYITRGRKNN